MTSWGSFYAGEEHLSISRMMPYCTPASHQKTATAFLLFFQKPETPISFGLPTPRTPQRPEPEKLILQVFGNEVRSPRLPTFRSNCNKFYWMLPFCLAKKIDGLHLFTMVWPTSRLVVRAMTAIAAMSDSDTGALCASGYAIQSL